MKDQRGTWVLGLLLIVVGGLLLVGQLLGFNFWSLAWPLFIIGPGALLLVTAFLGGRKTSGLAVPGCIVSMVGLLLWYQNTFNHFESWAYAWALIAPTAVGAGLIIHGLLDQQPKLVRDGRGMVTAGLAIFAVMGVLFEGLIFKRQLFGGVAIWPLILIGIGLVQLLTAVLAPRKAAKSETAPQEPRAPGKED
jgi:hypothetical protein